MFSADSADFPAGKAFESMKPLFHYQEKKFRALSKPAQRKAFTRLVRELERQSCQAKPDPELVGMIARMADWMDTEDPVLTSFMDLATWGTDRRETALKAAAWLITQEAVPRDDAIPVRQYDGLRLSDPHFLERAHNMVVILEDLRSAFNAGSIFRTAECLGIGELWLCGITSRPGEAALSKTAMGTTEKVAWRGFATALKAVETAREQGRIVYALETSGQAVSVFDASISFPCALVVGNEALGISPEVLKASDELLELPVMGWKNSLNVGVAFAVCAYQMIFKGAK